MVGNYLIVLKKESVSTFPTYVLNRPSSLSLRILFTSIFLSVHLMQTISSMQIMVESWIVCRMDLLLSFFNLCMQGFFESVCVGSQKRRIELEDNKDHFSFLL